MLGDPFLMEFSRIQRVRDLLNSSEFSKVWQGLNPPPLFFFFFPRASSFFVFFFDGIFADPTCKRPFKLLGIQQGLARSKPPSIFFRYRPWICFDLSYPFSDGCRDEDPRAF